MTELGNKKTVVDSIYPYAVSPENYFDCEQDDLIVINSYEMPPFPKYCSKL